MATMNWHEQTLTILGLSKSGCAVAEYVQTRGGQCLISESLPASQNNEKLRQKMLDLGVQVEMGGHSKQVFTHAPMVIASPGIPPSTPVMQEIRHCGLPILSEVELAYRQAPQVPIVGITGTNGKTTTTTLISAILTRAGWQAPACGNIGTPLMEVLHQGTPDALVAELSSYQLALTEQFRAKIGVFLNLTPDHLDWHGSMEAYTKAKLKLFTQNPPEWCVVLADDPVSMRILTEARTEVLGFSRHGVQAPFANGLTVDGEGWITLTMAGQDPVRFFNVADLQILGPHNVENVLAAVGATHLLGIDPAVIHAACKDFAGVEHRLEKVVAPDGRVYYNDSKATNPEATLSALRAFGPEQSVVLIAGGRDKLGPLEEFVAEVALRVSAVVLIGEATERFAQALAVTSVPVHRADNLDTAIRLAERLADQGQPVLFSPACASFDMFANFEERGRVFKALVLQASAPLAL
jgi:UDP-N-acetylmuramoylalanine--D-glutamate ligase